MPIARRGIMGYSLEALMQAARRAMDVAVLVDAARVLTFMAKAKARERRLDPSAASTQEIESIYQAASELTLIGRVLVAEADMLLATAQQPLVAGFTTPDPDADDLETLRFQLCASMDETLKAIELLENIQELGAEELNVGPLGTLAARSQRDEVQALLARLRR